MSITLAITIKDHEQRIAELERLIKANNLQSEIESLKSRLSALEQRPKPGRPPKEQNG